MKIRNRHNGKQGVTLLAFLGILAVVSILSMAMFTKVLESYASSKQLERNLQAMHLAEAGLELALHRLHYVDPGTRSIERQKLGEGCVDIVIEQRENNQLFIMTTGYVPEERHAIQRTIHALVIKEGDTFSVTEKLVF